MCVSILLTCMYVQYVYTWCSRRPERDVRFSGDTEIRVVMITMWVLGTKPGASARAVARVLNAELSLWATGFAFLSQSLTV